MPTTQRDAQALTYLARRLREETHGAREWDQNGTYAVIARLIGHNLPMVVERVTRHASDVEAKTPGAIERPFVPDAPKAGPVYPPKRDEACLTCGRHIAGCICGEQRTRAVTVDPEVAHRGAALARELLSHPQHEATDTEENKSA